MNYLGHAFLSLNNADITTGNLIGDHVKGMLALQHYPDGIRRGILLHRFIDSYVDSHPSVARAKVVFRQDYGLYAGAILDTLFDHFLANDPRYFPSDIDLKTFTHQVYLSVESNNQYLPAPFAAYFQHMKERNWLFGYKSLLGMQRALTGLHRRARHMPDPSQAYTIFVSSYYQLNQCYFEFIDDLQKKVSTKVASI